MRRVLLSAIMALVMVAAWGGLEGALANGRSQGQTQAQADELLEPALRELLKAFDDLPTTDVNKRLPTTDVNKALAVSYELLEKGKFEAAQKVLDQVLKQDPGNPLALNNYAAIMVKQKKFDKAELYLNQALPRAKGYMVQVNRVLQVGGICLAFQPHMGGAGNQELAPLVMLNLDMIKNYLSQQPLPAAKGR